MCTDGVVVTFDWLSLPESCQHDPGSRQSFSRAGFRRQRNQARHCFREGKNAGPVESWSPGFSRLLCRSHRLPAELLYLPTHSSTGRGPGFPDRGRSALQPHTRHGVQSEHTAGAGVQGGSRGVSGLTEQQDGPAQSRLLPCLST